MKYLTVFLLFAIVFAMYLLISSVVVCRAYEGFEDSCGNVFQDCFNCQDFKKRDEGDSYETIYVKG